MRREHRMQLARRGWLPGGASCYWGDAQVPSADLRDRQRLELGVDRGDLGVVLAEELGCDREQLRLLGEVLGERGGVLPAARPLLDRLVVDDGAAVALGRHVERACASRRRGRASGAIIFLEL